LKQLDYTVDRTGLVWALGSLCQLHKIPFDANLLLQQITPPYNVAGLLNAGQQLGLKIKTQTTELRDVSALPLPCIALLNAQTNEDKPFVESAPTQRPIDRIEPTFIDSNSLDVESSPNDVDNVPPTFNVVLILRADQDRVLCIGVGEQNPSLLPVAEFAARFTGQVILAGAEQTTAVPDDTADAPVTAAGAKPSSSTFGFKWFIPELLKHKSIWRDVLLASLAIQLMALATPLFTQAIIDKVIVHRTMSTLTVIGIALAVFMLFTAVMTWVRQYLVIHTGNRVDAVLGTQVFSHLFKLPTRYFEQRPTGVVVARMHAIEDIREFITGAAVTLVLDFPFLLIFLGIMFYYSVPLTLLSLCLLAVIVGLSFIVAPMFRARLNQQFLLGARNQAFLTEYVSGMETVKSLQMEPQLNSKYGNYMADYLQAGFKTKTLGNTYNTIANTLEQGMTLAILCVGAYLVMNRPDFSIGMLVAFQMFAGRLSQPLLRLVGLWQQFQQASISVKRLGDVLNAPTEPYSLIPAREGNGAGKIEIKSLAFRYADNLPFLYKDFNFTLDPGKILALMGASGTGKSTLAKLLQGFYQPADGQILIDGRDIRYLSANELRSHFGVVPQETILFSGTLYDNLILANPHASFEEVIQACKWAEIHEVIEKLPKGYQTEVGERGVGLSGGQKQRIAIARALLRKPKILLFDEATSNLDLQTAEHFAKTINALKGQVTMLFIAHQIPKGLKLDGVVQIGNPGHGDERRLDIVSNESETTQGAPR
jgi:ATP-binding cassette, subfamily B, bacterial HlyB/CyaB